MMMWILPDLVNEKRNHHPDRNSSHIRCRIPLFRRSFRGESLPAFFHETDNNQGAPKSSQSAEARQQTAAKT
jgi:hypothetical protein